MNYPQIFSELGFSPKEVTVYVALLELFAGTPTEIAKKTNLNRTTCYDTLASLQKRGLVGKYRKQKKIYFHAADPRQLLAYLDREKQEYEKKIDRQKKKIEEALPELMSKLSPQQNSPKVEFFEGEKGMREAYEDTLNSKEYYYAYANHESMHEGMPDFFPEYYKRRVKAGILGKGIFPQNKSSLAQAKLNKQEKRQSLFLSDAKKTFTPEVILYDNKMLIASWKEKMAVIIESKELSQLQKLIFEELWKYMKNDPDVKKEIPE
ncbi:MAG: helix-turn-helix domain-containing protein [Candidatus Magasanikbacteria bacterium]